MDAVIQANLSVNSSQGFEENNAVEIPQSEVLFHEVLYQITTPVIFSLIMIIGIVGNVLVIFVILHNRKMRNNVNILLLNLAFSDIVFLTLCVPLIVYHFAAPEWEMGDVICKLHQFLFYVTVYVTIYTLVLISVIRFLTIVHGSKTVEIRSKTNACTMIGLIWGVMMIVNIPIILIYRVKEIKEEGHDVYHYCGLEDTKTGRNLFISFALFAYLLPLVVICTLYILILRYLRQRKRPPSTDSNGESHNTGPCCDKTTHATRIVVAVVLVFGVCWLPLHIHLLISYLTQYPLSELYQIFRVACLSLAYSNSCFNPLIYNYVSRDFRDQFRQVRMGCNETTARDNNLEEIALNGNLRGYDNREITITHAADV